VGIHDCRQLGAGAADAVWLAHKPASPAAQASRAIVPGANSRRALRPYGDPYSEIDRWVTVIMFLLPFDVHRVANSFPAIQRDQQAEP